MRFSIAVAAGAALLSIALVGAAPASKARAAKHHSASGQRHSIWVDKLHQRLYAFSGHRLVLDAKCSTAAHKRKWAPGLHRYVETGTPSGYFHIKRKDSNHWSKAYQVHMLWSLFFGEGRAIHGTSPSEYKKLGKAASAGCVRLTGARAKALYRWAHVGDSVYIVHSLPLTVSSLVHHSRSGKVLLQHKK